MSPDQPKPNPKGRGSHLHLPNRFEAVRTEPDFEQCEHDEELLAELDHCETEYFADQSQTVVSENNSPDISFRYSLNPYRGCSHGCSYCYARPTHEYLGFNAGLDFETRIMVKHDAAALLRAFLARPKWVPETIVMSGVTDCYQPAERRFGITRQCLEVALEARQAIGIITKNALVLRDLDLLREMASMDLVHVSISVTTLDAELARTMEPRTSTPAARLRAIRELSQAGIPVRVMAAPIIPSLNDREIPAILEAAAKAGAKAASYTLLRLPLTVKPVFLEWLERTQPLAREADRRFDPRHARRQTQQSEVRRAHARQRRNRGANLQNLPRLQDEAPSRRRIATLQSLGLPRPKRRERARCGCFDRPPR